MLLRWRVYKENVDWGVFLFTGDASVTNFSPAATAGNCHFKSSLERRTRREAAIADSSPRIGSGKFTGAPLLGENKYLRFAFKTQFKNSAFAVGYDDRVR